MERPEKPRNPAQREDDAGRGSGPAVPLCQNLNSIRASNVADIESIAGELFTVRLRLSCQIVHRPGFSESVLLGGRPYHLLGSWRSPFERLAELVVAQRNAGSSRRGGKEFGPPTPCGDGYPAHRPIAGLRRRTVPCNWPFIPWPRADAGCVVASQAWVLVSNRQRGGTPVIVLPHATLVRRPLPVDAVSELPRWWPKGSRCHWCTRRWFSPRRPC